MGKTTGESLKNQKNPASLTKVEGTFWETKKMKVATKKGEVGLYENEGKKKNV